MLQLNHSAKRSKNMKILLNSFHNCCDFFIASAQCHAVEGCKLDLSLVTLSMAHVIQESSLKETECVMLDDALPGPLDDGVM